jgi:hypothetical protein
MQLSNLVIPLPTPIQEEDETVPADTLPVIKTPTKTCPTSPSGLSLLIAREREAVSRTATTTIESASSSRYQPTEHVPYPALGSDTPSSASVVDLSYEYLLDRPQPPPHRRASQVTPLLPRRPDGNTYIPTHFVPANRQPSLAKSLYVFLSESRNPKNIKHVLATAIQSIPAVILGCLINILDGVSCESIVAPHLFI